MILPISDASGVIAAAIAKQGIATREIARKVQTASDGTARVGSAIADVHQGAAAWPVAVWAGQPAQAGSR